MEKIASFTVNHLTLLRGIYVSRRDVTASGDVITTFDIRMTEPNRQPALSGKALHAIEHLAATFLRNHPQWKQRIIYWGPMGCRTGNYLLVNGELSSEDVLPLMRETFAFIADFEGEIPGATARDCGNYTYMEFKLETGRTHQIRVHMASIGHPLLGDNLYSSGKCSIQKLQGQTLHAKTIGFIHPSTNEYMEFSAPLPEYFVKLLTKLKNMK